MIERSATVKADAAFRTISEVARETGVAAHILRYWETRFPQLRPLQRAGNRRYYRPADVVLVRRIDSLLNAQGYTIKGVQKLLAEDMPEPAAKASIVAELASKVSPADMLAEVRAIRDAMAEALLADR